MKTNPTLSKIVRAAKKNEFIRFTYEKSDGEVSERTVRFGSDIAKRLKKEDRPINGRGAWMTGHGHGLRSMIVTRGGKTYLRGTDVTSGKETGHKIFSLSGIKLSDNK